MLRVRIRDFFLSYLNFLLYVSEFLVPSVCLCTMGLPGAHRGQKKMSGLQGWS